MLLLPTWCKGGILVQLFSLSPKRQRSFAKIFKLHSKKTECCDGGHKGIHIHWHANILIKRRTGLVEGLDFLLDELFIVYDTC